MNAVEYLDIVNEEDEVVGRAEFVEAHQIGLRHRSVQVLVFHPEDKNKLLVCKRSKFTVGDPSMFCPSVSGHVKSGQTYLEAAKEEMLEELFSGRDRLPEGIEFNEISTFRNDGGRATNKENTCLFVSFWDDDFNIEEEELEEIFWKDFDEVLEDIETNRDEYTHSFLKAVEEYCKVR